MIRKSLLILAICAAAAGCSDRMPASVLAPTNAAPQAGARIVQVHAVTTRQRQPGQPYAFGAGRAPELTFASFDISIPPTHRSGEIEWAEGEPDPAKDFITLRQEVLPRQTFKKEVEAKNVGIFIHGFNQSFQEALFRTAQMGADSSLGAQPILFSWSSEGHLSSYLADRDAADFARDGLVDTLTLLARSRPAGGRVRVLAHSMGARLTMEALRQLRLEGRGDVLDRLEVILAAPDIDVDVFRRQANVIGPMREPMTVLVATDDKALALSSKLSARRQRVGAIDLNNPRVQKAVQESGMRVIDISSIQPDSIAHSRFVGLIALYPRLDQPSYANNPVTGVRRAGGFVFDAVGVTFDSIGTILAD
ncbi:alpha/beta hydrolase [Paracoccus sp. (in: a-proteobacteria)]|uniref:alpha/beta hydrolase n=1 Tax=Paracoccus sp. TaxID=267 RepID=UPI0032200E77